MPRVLGCRCCSPPTGGTHVLEKGPVEPATINDPMNHIRQLAADAGRGPSTMDIIMRVYPVMQGKVDDVVTSILRASEETDVDHFFVGMVNIAETVDQSLETAELVLSKARG